MKSPIAIGVGILGAAALLSRQNEQESGKTELHTASLPSASSSLRGNNHYNLDHEGITEVPQQSPAPLTLQILAQNASEGGLPDCNFEDRTRTAYLQEIAQSGQLASENQAARSQLFLEQASNAHVAPHVPTRYQSRSNLQMGAPHRQLEPMLLLDGKSLERLEKEREQADRELNSKKSVIEKNSESESSKSDDDTSQASPETTDSSETVSGASHELSEPARRPASEAGNSETPRQDKASNLRSDTADVSPERWPSIDPTLIMVLPEASQAERDTMATMVRGRGLFFIDMRTTENGTEYIYQRTGSGENIETERLTFLQGKDGNIYARYEGTDLKFQGLELMSGDDVKQPHFPLGDPPVVRIPGQKIEGSNGFFCNELVHLDGSLSSLCSGWSLLDASWAFRVGLKTPPTFDFSIRGPNLQSSISYLEPPVFDGQKVELRGVKVKAIGGFAVGYKLTPTGIAANNGTGGLSASLYTISAPLKDLPDSSFPQFRDGFKSENKPAADSAGSQNSPEAKPNKLP